MAGVRSVESVVSRLYAPPHALAYAVAAVCTGELLLMAGLAVSGAGHDRLSFAERGLPPAVLLAGLVVVGAEVLAVWVTASRHPVSAGGWALALIGALTPLGAAWPGLAAHVAVALLAASPLVVLGILVGVTGPPPPDVGVPRTRTLVGGLVGCAVLVLACGYDPFLDPGCARTCVEAPAVLATVISTRTAVVLATGATVAAAVLAAELTSRPARTRRPGVRLLDRVRAEPTSYAGTVALLLAAALAVTRLTTWGDSRAGSEQVLLLMLVPAAPAGVVLLEAARLRRRRTALHEIVDALSRDQPVTRGRSGPVVAVHFSEPGSTDWFEARGGRADVDTSLRAVVLRGDHGPTIRLDLARGALEQDVLDVLTPATRLALRNAALGASLRRRMHEVQDSQRRIIEVSDAERQRIERDLHDGAQQRLVGISLHLRLAGNGAPAGEAEVLRDGEASVLEVLGHLRQVPPGPAPALLLDEGLVAALRHLIGVGLERCHTDMHVPGPVPQPAAVALHATVAQVVSGLTDQGPDLRGEVVLAQASDGLRLTLTFTGLTRPVPEDGWADAADRVGALRGRFAVHQVASRLRVEAVVPCVW